MPTVIEPLREEWDAVQAAALQLDRDGKRDKAIAELHAFHRRLCQVRVLDPPAARATSSTSPSSTSSGWKARC